METVIMERSFGIIETGCLVNELQKKKQERLYLCGTGKPTSQVEYSFAGGRIIAL